MSLGSDEITETQESLERKGYEGIDDHAQQPGVEDGFEGIGLGVLEFARIAHGRLETVG